MGVTSLFSPPKTRTVASVQETEKEIEDPDAKDKKRRRQQFTNIATSVSGASTPEENIGRRKLLGG